MTASPTNRPQDRFAQQSSLLQRFLRSQYAGALICLVLISVYLGITQPIFLSWPNLMNIVKSNSVVFVLALGATYVVISGGIDLSVASIMAASAMIFGLTIHAGFPGPLAILAALAFGLFLGFLNGYLIAYLKISFFVVTLGALSIYQSFALVINDGTSLSVFAFASFKPITAFFNGNTGPFPNLLLLDIALLLIAGGVLRYTGFGRALYAIGSNIEAARLNGINVKRVTLYVSMVAGGCAALGAVILVGRLTTAPADVDPTLLMTVLAAVLIGGTAFSGGEGGVFGTMIGVLFLGVIQNGLTLSGVSSFWQGMVSGGILIFAVWLGGVRALLRRKRQAG